MSLTRNQVKKILREELKNVRKKFNESAKSRQALLENQIKEVESNISSLLTEVDDDHRTHILENQNNIFIPMLDETTGETRYEARNFDEYLEECVNDNTKPVENRLDHVLAVLDESFEHEKPFYFGDNLDAPGFSAQKQEKGNMTLEDVKRTIREQEEEEKKSWVQRGKEKVTGAIKGAKEKVKGTFKKGMLIGTLKVIQMGLKVALTATKSVLGLVVKLVIPLAKNLAGKLAAGKMKVSSMWATVKEWGMSKLEKLMEKILSPFLWIAKKITGSTAEAAEVAPLLFSITVMSLTLAWLYLSSGVAVFSTFTSSLTDGASAVMEAGGEELVGQICAEAKTHNGQILSGQLLVEQGCGIVDAQGNEISHDVAAQVMKNLGAKINAGLEEAKGITMTAISQTGAEDVDTLDLGAVVDAQADALEEIGNHFRGVTAAISTDGKLRMEDLTSGAAKALQAEISAVQKLGTALPEIGEEGVKKLVDGMTISHHVDTATTLISTVSNGVEKEVMTTFTNVKVAGVTGLDEEVTLTESKFRRFQELAGVIKG
jgi:hypothetical protein